MGRFLEQELSDQVFQDQRRLRKVDLTAVFQIGFGAPRGDPDVLVAKQSVRQYTRAGVRRNFIVSVPDPHRDHRLQTFGIQCDLGNPANRDSRHGYRRPRLQAADVGEGGADLVTTSVFERPKIRGLRRKEKQRPQSQQDEKASSNFESAVLPHYMPPEYINDVIRKSKANIARDEITTVRVVDRPTPSAVGMEV